jgi:ATP-dependent helicase/nuclease subunit B
MSGLILRVGPGAEAEDALAGTVRHAQRADPLATVTVVVRGHAVGLDLRRRLAERGPLAGTRTVTLRALTELLVTSGGGAGLAGLAARRPLSRAALGAAIRLSLSEAPSVFTAALEHPSTETSLARSYDQLRPLSRGERAMLASMSPRAHDVVRIVDRCEGLLERSRYDAHDLTTAAVALLTSGTADLDAIGSVIVFLPDPLSSAEVGLLRALARCCPVTVMAGSTGDEAADAATEAMVEELGSLGSYDLAAADRDERGAPSSVVPTFSRVIGAPDAEEEVRLAARLLIAHLERGGDLGKTAVVLPNGEGGRGYLGMVEEVFSRAGIPWASSSGPTLGESPLGLVVLGLLEVFVDEERPFGRAEVVRWLSSPALSPAARLWDGLTFTRHRFERVPAGAFDHCSRRAGIVGGADDWQRRLSSYRRHRLEASPEASREGPRPSVDTASDLLEVIGRLAESARELEGCHNWQEVADWGAALARLVLERGEVSEPIVDALASLAELADLEPLAPMGAGARAGAERRRQIRSAFAAALSSPGARHGRFGAGPVVGALQALAGVRCDLLIVLGCREGLLPGRSAEDPLVTDLEREAVGTLARTERVEHRDRRNLLTLLAGAEEAVALYPRVERGAGRFSYPSRWLTDDLFRLPHEEVASYPEALGLVARAELAPLDAYELELAVSSGRLAGRGGLDGLFVAELDDLPRRIAGERERHRRGPGLSRFGGLAGPHPANQEIYDETLSATRIENLATCPLRFMFSRLLRLQVLEAPERLDTISPLDRGTLIHEVLEEFVETTVLQRDGFTGWSDDDLDLLRRIGERHCDVAEARGLTGRPLYWHLERRQLLADLERFVRIESKRLAESKGRPVQTEFGFGDGVVPPVEITLRGGSVLRFRGKIDRIDEEAGGTLRVVDYKSGSASGYLQIASEPLGGGRYLQLPVYAKAAAELGGGRAARVVAEYRFCSAAGGFRRVPVELTDSLEQHLLEVLRALGGLIDNGTFPPRPGGDESHQDNCTHCDYSAICRLDRGAMWERAAADAKMADFVALSAAPSNPEPA